MPTRAWEMLAGGLVWWATRQHSMSRQWARLAEGVGFALIIWAIATFDPAMRWPGYLALVPVVGAMLVLAANRQRSWLTANPFARQLGASSYSIYLWHWPLVVLLTYAGEQANSQWMALGVLGSVLFGELSLRCVENPARKGLSRSGLWVQSGQLAFVTSAIGLAAVMVWVGINVVHPNMIARIDRKIGIVADESNNFNPRRDICHIGPGKGIYSPLCRFGDLQEPAVVVIGDSHASALVSSVATAAGGAIQLTYSACATVSGLKMREHYDNSCEKFNEYVINLINEKYQTNPLVLASRSSIAIRGYNEGNEYQRMPAGYFDTPSDQPNAVLDKKFSDNLIDAVCSLVNSDRVYLMRPIPEMGVDVPKTMARALMFGKADPQISISLQEYHDRHKVVWGAQDAAAAKCGVKILDPLPYLCHDGRCWGSKDGRPIYYDDDHLSEYGNKLLVPMFKQVFAASVSQ